MLLLFGASGGVTVDAPMATATAAANAPAIAQAVVTAPIATATAAANAPTIDTTNGTTITAPMAVATAAANAPTLKVDSIVTAPLATATGVANAPVITHPVTAPLATATAAANIPKPRPANDDFANAQLISGASGSVGPIDIDAATKEGGEPQGSNLDAEVFGYDPPGPYETVWFKWVAPSNSEVTFTTINSVRRPAGWGGQAVPSGDPSGHLDTTMAIWTGTALNNLVEVTSNEDVNDLTLPDEADNWYSVCTFVPASGTTYYIQVGTYDPRYHGDLTMDWSSTPNATITAPAATALASAPNEVLGPGRLTGGGGPESGAIPAVSKRALQAAIGVRNGIPGVGQVEHMIVSKTGEVDYPIVGGAEWDEQVPGGWWTATGLVSKNQRRHHLGVYKEGSTWMIFESATGHLIWQGRIHQPKREEGQVRIEADGLGKRVSEASIRHRMLYQTWDLSEWTDNLVGSPFGQDPGNTLDTTADASTVNDVWDLQISGGFMFTRDSYHLDDKPGGVSFENASPMATFFADDLAEPGLTGLQFNVHVFTSGTFGGSANIDMYRTTPFPPYMVINYGRWDPRLADASQGGWFAAAKWFPDPNGAGQWAYGEELNQWERWFISPYYNDDTDFDGGGYTPSVGYSPVPFKYSDRVGDPGHFLVPTTGLVSQEPGAGRRWTNIPYLRPAELSGAGYPYDTWFTFTNTADPNATETMEVLNHPTFDLRYWDPYPVNIFSVRWEDQTFLTRIGSNDSVNHARIQMQDIRVQGIAPGDNFSVSEMARDVARRRGLSDSGVDSCAINAVPYDLKEGTWGDILDHAALLSGWIWRVSCHPDGGRPRLDFSRWGRTGGWIVDDDRTPFNLEPTETYFSVDVPYKYPHKGTDLSGVAHVRWPEVPPGSARDYGLIQLDQPVHSRELAENLGLRILNRLRKRHFAGDATISKVRRRNGMEQSAYLVKAGNVIHHWPSHRKLRVQGVHKTYDGVELTFDWGHAVVDAITARRNLRMSAQNRV